MASRTLYPVSVDSTQEAIYFKATGSTNVEPVCLLYFEPSSFNNSIYENYEKYVAQVSVRSAATGESVVYPVDSTNVVDKTETKYVDDYYTATGIILDLGIKKNDDGRLYIEIPQKTLKEGHFAIDKAYNFQIRILSSDVSYAKVKEIVGENTYYPESAYITNYAGQFSEWSTVTLAVCIGEPHLTNTETEVVWTSPLYEYIDTFYCIDGNEQLDSYTIQIGDYKSAEIFTNTYETPNEIHYIHPKELTDGNYDVIINYRTKNKYYGKYQFTLKVQLDNTGNANIYEVAEALGKDVDEGRITLKVDQSDLTEDAALYRAVYKKNQAREWKKIQNNITNGYYYDYTIESGTYYDYAIKDNGKLYISDNEGHHFRRNFEYNYLVGQDEVQLKLPFDMKMNSFKINVSDQDQTTIGSPYPFISRTNSIYYRTFPISGVITLHMDDDNTFLSAEEYTSEELDNYYKERENIGYIQERDFRQQVIKFLLNGQPKLFKSTTEGNVIVRLTDVNFTPNLQLSRKIYSFTANAKEVAEYTVEKCDKYKIQHIKKAAEFDYKFHKNIDNNHLLKRD